jgi:predicted 3-demethylubiquinone-9 3-methyltransferase (glyoxalase superfamily)
MRKQEMAICLWFNSQAEEAANFYASIFEDSEIGHISRFSKEGFEHHGKPEGTLMSVDFRLNKMKFVALNGNYDHNFNESVSITVYCDTQEEIDHYWTKLSEGGKEQMCGWLKDKYGISWQIIPTILLAYFADSDPVKRQRVAAKMFEMIKFDIGTLKKAYDGD